MPPPPPVGGGFSSEWCANARERHQTGICIPYQRFIFRCGERIDGSWGVDALIGRQTREHADLDVTVHRKNNPGIRGLLENIVYREIKHADSSDCIYFMKKKIIGE